MASSDPQSARHRRAASGHARLGYAGGSRRSSEPFAIGDPELARVLDRKSFARNFGTGRNCYGRNYANHKRHIPTWQACLNSLDQANGPFVPGGMGGTRVGLGGRVRSRAKRTKNARGEYFC